MSSCELIREDYSPAAKPYPIISPEIASGNIYFFITDSMLEYEVRFGRKKDNYLGNVINFGVLNEEFESEYSLTNRGEIYQIIATVIEIVRKYHSYHPTSNSYEFTGDYKSGEKQKNSIRSRLYFRYANKVLCEGWRATLFENKVTISRN
jgi:hypothetical protein